jgi:3-deoxy-7-phosphoheptulonate synthase
MKRTSDLRIKEYIELMTPNSLKRELPMTATANETVVDARKTINAILNREDRRLLVVTGPCSIHDEDAALEYARRINELRRKVEDRLFLVMRVYFEKPRTTVGWKGLINDPNLDGTCDMMAGLHKARRILLAINEMGVPTATEMLEPITPQYVADLVSWSAIGARTTESQTHREMASGLSMPVGFKNGTDGNLASAINAMLAARAPQSFLGIDQDGRTCVVKTTGNERGHVVLRGGKKPNYDPISIEETRLTLIQKGLPEAIVVDCSHANSMKKFQGQAPVWKNVINQYISGSDAVVGLMLESNLHQGNQKYTGDVANLKYGVSITDECISWEDTEKLICGAHQKLTQAREAEPAVAVW